MILYDAAAKLSEAERADIAFRLLQTLRPPGIGSESDPGFLDELQRRLDEFRHDPGTASTWEDVSERLQQRLNSRNPS